MIMKVIVTFSGGKDSLASLLWVRNNLTKDFITVFCDTGWEHPLTYQYIKEIREKLDVIGISSEQVDKNQVVVKHVKIDGKHCGCMTRRDDSYIVAVTVEDSVYLQGTLLAILIVGTYLVLATC